MRAGLSCRQDDIAAAPTPAGQTSPLSDSELAEGIKK